LDLCGDLTTEICEMRCLFIFKETLVNNNNVHSLDYNNCMDSHVCNNNQDECSAHMQNYMCVTTKDLISNYKEGNLMT
jgi:hypothetical protein